MIFVEFVTRKISICEKKEQTFPDRKPNAKVNLNHEKYNKKVLLQSAVLQIEDIGNSNYCTNGAILSDTGSQRSFATESISKRLK